jgi:membrane AbrB-like protein
VSDPGRDEVQGEGGGLRPVVLGLALAVLAGFIAQRLRMPLPWMIGPLFSTGIARTLGAPIAVVPGARFAGQWIIGTALGLYFTPQVVREVVGFAPLILVSAVISVAIGHVSGRALAHLAREDRATAFFGSVPGGATEMSVLGERFGAKPDRVAVAQSLRIAMVVAIIPGGVLALGFHGADRYEQAARAVSAPGLLALGALTAVGGWVFSRLRVPNGWVLGALAVSIPLTAFRVELSAVPSWLSNAGQCLLGCALGARFTREFLGRAPRFVSAVSATVLLSIVLSASSALALAWASGVHPATLVLAMAPGGIAEMSITAKVLQLGVPMVTAFHVTRLVVLVTTTAPIYAALTRGRLRS